MELRHLIVVNLRLRASPVLEYAGRNFEQGPLSWMDHRRVYPEPACHVGGRLFAFKGFQRDLGVELRRGLLPFRHL